MPSVKKKKGKKNGNEKYNMKWIILITMWTFFLAICISMISENIMRNLNIVMALTTLTVIISFGVAFDIIGIAVTAAKEDTFHSMAANKIYEAKYAIRLVRNAGPVSNFCSDVIGDIAGIVSGAAGTIIVIKIIEIYGIRDGTFISIVMSGIIAALTVGGKAYGKEIAINNADDIIYKTGKVFMLFYIKFGVDLLPPLKKTEKGR